MTKVILKKNWYKEVWEEWDKNPVNVEKELGTHPFGGGSTEPFTGQHPEVMLEHPLYKEWLKNKGLQILITSSPTERKDFKNYSMSNNDLFDLPKNIYLIQIEYTLEKFSYKQVADLLINLYDKLLVGGVIKINTYDLKGLTESYIKGKLNYPEFIQKLYSSQLHEHDFNLMLFDSVALNTILKEVGFTQIKIEAQNNFIISAIAKKEKEF